MNVRIGLLTCVVCVLSVGPALRATAQETIPEAVARGATRRGSTVPSGKAPTVESLLATTDLVVRGVVGQPRTYLSENQQDVYSDYTLQDARVLYQRDAVTATRPGPPSPITFTQLGGTIDIAGVAFSHIDGGLPPLVPGTEVVALLIKDGDTFRIAGSFLGIFRVSGGSLFRLTKKEAFAPELEGRSADPATAAISAVARELHSARER